MAITSAASWFYGSQVKVTREKMVARRKREAAKSGEPPNFAGISLDGWDMSDTFAAQSRWNAVGAIAAGISVLAQAIGPYL
ncbi:hypothetical protein [Sphingomonas sp. CFBP 8760]|uniref:hypothetical protein n=1 Tax=Sphingomonas sp. CFBP 8760 TaxID=2775282 RepID=UPI001A915603|nr:hypothetical protein [Sphingomonas sp. CFBP 8760]